MHRLAQHYQSKRKLFFPIAFISFLIRFLFHPITVAIVHVVIWGYAAWDLSDGFTHTSMKLSLSSADVGINDLVILYSMVAYLSLGLGTILFRIIRKAPPFLPSAFFLATSVWLWLWVRDYSYYDTLQTILLWGAAWELVFATAITFACIVVTYLASREPGPVVSDIRNIPSNVSRMRAFLRSRDAVAWGMLALIGVQTIAIVLLWFRLGLVERKLGGLRNLACNEENVLNEIRKSTVRIVGENGEGTGMMIRPDGIILTNAHVVEQETSPKIIFPDYSFRTGEVVMLDSEADIALVRVERGEYPVVALGRADGLRPYDPVYVVGYPLGTDLRGDASVANGRFITTRSMKGSSVNYLQFDGAINPGNSGGPVIAACGDVVGMATSGAPGLGLAITAESIHKVIDYFTDTAISLSRVNPPVLDPDKSPTDTVTAFYTYIKMRQFDKAYALLSQKRIKDIAFPTWIVGYEKTLDVTLVEAREISEKENFIFVKISSLDLDGQDVVPKYFEGEWELIEENATWKLGDSNIKEVKEPPFYWFWKE